MAKSTHKGREHTMTQFGFEPRPGHAPQHLAPDDVEVPGFTYGDPGESGIRAHAFGPQDLYFYVPFAAARRDKEFPEKLARMDEVVRIYEESPETFDPLAHPLDGKFANAVKSVPVRRSWPKVEPV